MPLGDEDWEIICLCTPLAVGLKAKATAEEGTGLSC